MAYATHKAEDYLNPINFTTTFDDAEYGRQQYEKGLQISRDSVYVTIAMNGVWGARGNDGSSTSSYEKIGHHKNTSDLLRGFIDGPAALIVHPEGRPHRIK